MSCIFIFSSCKTDFSAADTYEIQITLKSAEVTEAWLKLSALPPDARATYTVKRDTHTVFEGKLDKADTLIHDTGLEPAADYEYRAFINQQIVKSANLQITTMDTTSHNFTWQTYEFGGQTGSSVFYDVAIIDENDIWAVGEIYTEDDKFNAAHWDGEKWELHKILYKGGFWDINTVFAFGKTDVWFEAFIRWNGDRFIELEIPEILQGFGINKTWGTSSEDLYAVGNSGNIRHFDGQNWQKIESGTDLHIHDIWGGTNPKTGIQEILCVASNKYLNEGKELLQIDNEKVYSISNKGLPWSISSIWFMPDKKYYIEGDGIFEKKNLKQPRWENEPGQYTPYFTFKIRGIEINDIIAVGGLGDVMHFNGIFWKRIIEDAQLPNGNYYSVDFKKNIIIAVGDNNPQAVIAVGIHNILR